MNSFIQNFLVVCLSFSRDERITNFYWSLFFFMKKMQFSLKLKIALSACIHKPILIRRQGSEQSKRPLSS